MGTDWVELLDRRTAELILRANEDHLVALVESRARPLTGPTVWLEYYDPAQRSMQPFGRAISASERLRTLLAGEATLTEVKLELIEQFCTSAGLRLDYWGCSAEVFSGESEPPGAIRWEEFVAPLYGGKAHQGETSGRYLLTGANTADMVRSLRTNMADVTIMSEAHVSQLERWHEFCSQFPDYCVIYQLDF